jgi:hypothetical protein
VKNLSALFFRHFVHCRVLERDTVSIQLTLQKKKPVLVEAGLELTEEFNELHLLPSEGTLVQYQCLESTLQVANEDFPEGLSVQPARVRDPEVEDRSGTRDVPLESEAVVVRALVRLHVSSVHPVKVSNQLVCQM